MESHVAVVDRVPMRWLQRGSGPPMVLLHGLTTSPDLWRHVSPRLEGVRVLAWELVGHGKSIPAGRDRDISVRAQAGYLLDWLDHLEIERPVLAGHDLGGGVAQILAVNHPDRVAGMVLANSISYDSWPVPSVKAIGMAPDLVAKMPNAALKVVLGTLMARGHDDAATARASFDLHFQNYAETDGAAALARQAASLDVHDTLAVAYRLVDLDLPARVVWGVADQFQKPRYAERLARDLGTRPIAIRGGKHFTPEDHPEVVADVIQDLVEELSRR